MELVIIEKEVDGIVVRYYEDSYEDEELVSWVQEMVSDYREELSTAKLIDLTVDEAFAIDGVAYDYIGGRLYRI